ncbi:mitochondrial ribonuclease P protein 3-like isoform X1 [Varroa destructor]|uniref:PRORP domain-containing protein n=1 Tax=Varroa destructor TaxID=109461 RepID=A0A7M7K3J6_VARDE|nr:mitochondrial ribonuclease P protein 3-like isoform X1 [Varroa destructor]
MMRPLLRVISPISIIQLPSTRTSQTKASPLLSALENKIYDMIRMKKETMSWTDLRENEFPRLVKELLINTSCRPSPSIIGAQSFTNLVIRALAKNGQSALLSEFVQEHGIERLSVNQLAFYIGHCNKTEEIVKTWHYLKGRNGTLFDAASTTHLIEGLCQTSHWREVVPLINNLTEIEGTPINALRRFIRKLFEVGEIDEALKWFYELYTRNPGAPGRECEPALAKLDSACRIFEMAASMYLQFDKDFFLSPAWEPLFDVKLTSITYPSRCPKCKTRLLPPQEIRNDDLQKLRKAVKTQLIKQGDNLFETTTPAELAHFEEFMGRHGPFDVVLDGLNIGYRFGEKALAVEARRLATQEKKRVLVMGRRHMNRWPAVKNLPRGVLLYTMENISNDDPFMFLACLYSNVHCTIVSSDHFRDHKFKLSPRYKNEKDNCAAVIEITRLFTRWLNTRHRQVGQPPLKHDMVAQKDPGGWHLPILKNAEGIQGQLQPNLWACVRYKRS